MPDIAKKITNKTNHIFLKTKLFFWKLILLINCLQRLLVKLTELQKKNKTQNFGKYFLKFVMQRQIAKLKVKMARNDWIPCK